MPSVLTDNDVADVEPHRVAREIISKRFGEGAEVRQDMIGSFIAHGMSLQECADESLIQM